MKYDISTPAGRKVFDAEVAKSLGDYWSGRSEIAVSLGIADDKNGLRAVSASLKRGVRDGWAEVEGKGAWSKYRRKS